MPTLSHHSNIAPPHVKWTLPTSAFIIFMGVVSSISAQTNDVKEQVFSDTSYAFATLAGKTMALTIDKSESQTVPSKILPSNAIVIQSYAEDGSLTFKGYGRNTIDSTGTYTYSKISANVALEETVQISDKLPEPMTYKMVFIFDSAHSGRWFQNFGNGLVYFSGTFNSFPTE